MSFWTPATEERLKELVLRTSLSYREIAEMLGCTRNNAISKARKMLLIRSHEQITESRCRGRARREAK